MTILRERIETSMPIGDAFDFVADFANAARWDPGVASSERLDPGPLKVGARFRLGVRMGGRVAPMDYTISQLDRPNRVVLDGTGSSVVATDDIAFEAVDGRTVISYMADIRLTGPMGLLSPFLGGAFRRIGERARDGMQRALDQRAGGGADGGPAA